MSKPIAFPYKVYKNYPCPIIKLALYGEKNWFETEAYVDSGASFSLFSITEAQRIGINYMRGRKTLSMVGDGSLIPVYLHRLPVRIGSKDFRAAIGFSPRLGTGFNLLGRRDFFTHFDITFSDATRTIFFLPRK